MTSLSAYLFKLMHERNLKTQGNFLSHLVFFFFFFPSCICRLSGIRLASCSAVLILMITSILQGSVRTLPFSWVCRGNKEREWKKASSLIFEEQWMSLDSR